MSIDAILQYNEYRKFHRAEYFEPYAFQKAFYHARDAQNYHSGYYDTGDGELALQRALISANQVGKTAGAAIEVSYHLTGQYPDWWDGHRFNGPVSFLVAGKTNDTTRDVCQKELMGDPKIPDEQGSGAIPRDCILKTTRKPGVPDAVMAVTVRHISGGVSTVQFMAYEQGPNAFMGRRYDGAWGDEEPPQDVWSQILRCFFAVNHYTILLTFTPEEGMTQVVDGFLNNLKPGQAVVRATWDDAPHMTVDRREAFLAQLSPHERDMRSKGIPLMGSGLVFPIKEDEILIDPFPIPAHWRQICGIDFGIDHPFAAAWIAHDSDTDTVYLYNEYRQQGATPPIHAAAIKKVGNWIPVVWPHDGLAKDKGSGIPLADLYRHEGLPLRPEKFSNPPGPNQSEGQGGQGVEVGIVEMWQRMETGRFKVFSTCQGWLEEFRQYHRKDGQIVKLKDDVISASRYAMMSLRFAYTKPIIQKKTTSYRGVSNW